MLNQVFPKWQVTRALCWLSILVLVGCQKNCSSRSEPYSQVDPIQAESQQTAQGGTSVNGGQKLGAHENENDAAAPVARTLVFLGDSLTAGYGLNLSEAFPAKVQEKLRSAGMAWKVVNAGVSGDTTRGGLERVGWVLKAQPSIVFICLGANDGLRGLAVEESRKNLKAIIDAFLAKHVQVLLGGMELPVNYGSSYREEFRQMYVSLAEEYRLPFLPFLLEGMALKPELTLQDGIHPNAKGTDVIAENVWAFLGPLLQKD